MLRLQDFTDTLAPSVRWGDRWESSWDPWGLRSLLRTPGLRCSGQDGGRDPLPRPLWVIAK